MRRWLVGCVVLAACGLDVVDFEPRALSGNVEIIVVGSVSQASIDQFGTTQVKRDPKQLALSYPDDGVMLPADVAPINMRWNAAKPVKMPMPMPMTTPMTTPVGTVYELSLITSSSELRVYTLDTSVALPAARWSTLLAAPDVEPLSLRLRALTTSPKATLIEAALVSLHVTAALPSGSLYFETRAGIQRARLADPGASPLPLPVSV